MLFFFLLLGGDFRLQPASLDANLPQPAPRVVGTSNILFAPCTQFLDRPSFIGATALIVSVVVVTFSGLIYTLCSTLSCVLTSGIYWKRK